MLSFLADTGLGVAPLWKWRNNFNWDAGKLINMQIL